MSKNMKKSEREFLEKFPESIDLCSETNKAGVFGVIEREIEFSHEVFGENIYETQIEVLRYSKAVDHIPLLIPERLITSSLQKDVYVKVIGEFRSRNRHDDDGSSHLDLYLWCKSIKLSDDFEDPTNMISLNGYICAPPNYRTTPLGRKITDLRVATNLKYGKSAYIPCIAWNKNAIYAKSLQVGNLVKLFGRIQSRDYFKSSENIQKTAFEVSIEEIE